MHLILLFPVHLVLLSDIVGPGLHLHVIIHKVPDPAPLPQAPVPGQGVHQTPAAQAHQNWALAMSLMLDPTLDLDKWGFLPMIGRLDCTLMEATGCRLL